MNWTEDTIIKALKAYRDFNEVMTKNICDLLGDNRKNKRDIHIGSIWLSVLTIAVGYLLWYR